MFSYWERESFSKYGHIVIGAGITGLSTAIELKLKFPHKSVLVLERGLLPTGASSRNAGFACMGSVTELLDDLERMSEDDVVSLFERRKRGLAILRERLGDEPIGYKTNGSYELIGNEELYALDKVDYLNDLLRKTLGGDNAFEIQPSDIIQKFKFSEEYVKAVVKNLGEGELHTGKMMVALSKYAQNIGVEIKTGAEVAQFVEEENRIAVFVNDSFRKDMPVLYGDTVSICTNAYTKQLLPDAVVTPGRGQVLITKPIEHIPFKGIYHFDKGFYYFREINGRILLGGGRNVDFEGEETQEIAITDKIQEDLEDKLRTLIMPGEVIEVEQRWAGIMAFGPTKKPVVEAFKSRVFGAFRLGGMGVAVGSLVAKELAALNHYD